MNWREKTVIVISITMMLVATYGLVMENPVILNWSFLFVVPMGGLILWSEVKRKKDRR